MLSLDRFHQFDAITERVVDEHAIEAFERLVVRYPIAGKPDAFDQGGQVDNDERRVCLRGWAEVGIDTEMDLEIVVLEPASIASCQMGRFRDVRQSKHRLVEGDGLVLTTRGHGELYMFDSSKSHSTSTDWV